MTANQLAAEAHAILTDPAGPYRLDGIKNPELRFLGRFAAEKSHMPFCDEQSARVLARAFVQQMI
jgi:hypothetical protein